MNKRFAEVDGLLKSIRDDCDTKQVPKEWIKGVNFAIGCILRYPSVDITEIVYCKDCKHQDDPLCQIIKSLCGLEGYPYCIYGDRKEDDESRND